MTPVSDIQEDMGVSGGAITGKLKYYDDDRLSLQRWVEHSLAGNVEVISVDEA